MNPENGQRPGGRLLILSLTLVMGCAHGRQVVYPNGEGPGPSPLPRRVRRDRTPLINVHVEDQTKTLPQMLGD